MVNTFSNKIFRKIIFVVVVFAPPFVLSIEHNILLYILLCETNYEKHAWYIYIVSMIGNREKPKGESESVWMRAQT